MRCYQFIRRKDQRFGRSLISQGGKGCPGRPDMHSLRPGHLPNALGGNAMNPKLFFAFAGVALVCGMVLVAGRGLTAAPAPVNDDYTVLDAIRHGNLTVFPVVAAKTHDTSDFMTLDEGLRSGDVVVTEYGKVQGLVRGRDTRPRTWDDNVIPTRGGPQVNTLVLVNNSKRPLLLLAGEIVTGGKQDRVISKDRIVPAEGDPIDLDVFCVEPGRWVGSSAKFVPGTPNASMAAPSVRGKAMADKNQQQVWAEVAKAREGMASAVQVEAPQSTRELSGTTSYAKTMDNADVKKKVDSVAGSIEKEYASTIQQLRERKAVGVVVAVNGEIVWADIFASSSLLEKYWPKLVRSYATEAVVTRGKGAQLNESAAQSFLENLHGRHETVDSEPGLYRHTEVSGDGFKAFELTSLLPKTGFAVHVAKMTE